MEMIISVSVLALLGSCVASLVIHSLEGWSQGMSKSGAESASAIAANKLSQQVCIGSSATISGDELWVYIPDLVTDSYGETYYDPSVGTTRHRYYLYNGNLYRQIGDSTSQLFARDISSAVFSTAGNLVSFTITGKLTEGTSMREEQCKGSIVLRNYRK